MKKFYLFVFVIIIFIVQYSVLGMFFESGRIPNLFVAFCVSLAIMFGFEKSVGWVVLAGFLMDAGSPLFFGSGTLILVGILWLIENLKVVAELRSKRYYFVFLFSLLVFFSSFFFDLILKAAIRAEKYYFGVETNLGGFGTSRDYFFKYLFSTIFGIGIYFFVRKTKERSLPLSSLKRHG